MYKAYIFDFDYTLVNSEQAIVMCFEYLLRDEGYPAQPRDAITHTIGMSMYDAVSLLTGETDPDTIRGLHRIYKHRYADKYMTAYTKLFPDTKDTLAAIKAAGAQSFIVSSKTRSRINETLTKEAMTDLITAVVGAEDVEVVKPAPEGLQYILEHFQLSPTDVLYIGDSTIDAETAVNAGVDFAAVTTGVTEASAFLPYNPVKIMKSLSELKETL